MNIYQPNCGFNNCKFYFDGNCTSKIKYESCEYQYFSKTVYEMECAKVKAVYESLNLQVQPSNDI